MSSPIFVKHTKKGLSNAVFGLIEQSRRLRSRAPPVLRKFELMSILEAFGKSGIEAYVIGLRVTLLKGIGRRRFGRNAQIRRQRHFYR